MRFTRDEIEAARRTVYAAMPPTPQYAWPLLAQRLGCTVWVKHENHTPAGAFKVRGGLTYFETLAREQPAVRRVVSATRGNHGQSVGSRRGVTDWRRASWCRTATRSRRTLRCGRWASR
jgi:threonine dehydratase